MTKLIDKTETGYRFEKTGHSHYLDGKRLTGVTTVLSVIAKPALIQWAANMAVDYIKEHSYPSAKNLFSYESIILDEARKAHTQKRDKAGDWGTKVHEWVEGYIKGMMDSSFKPTFPMLEEKQALAIKHFSDWVRSNNVHFLESEKHLHSRELWLGGIADLVCEIDGKVWVADIKTSSGIYPEAFWQMAAYQLLIEEMGLYKDIAGHIVLNLKKDGSFEEKRSISNDDNKEAFLAALKIYRIQEKLKNQII